MVLHRKHYVTKVDEPFISMVVDITCVVDEILSCSHTCTLYLIL